MSYANQNLIKNYCKDILSGKLPANKYQIKGVERYLRDLKNEEYDFRPRDAEFVIGLIENTIVHAQGERLDGSPLQGEPFLLEPFHKYMIYNLLGFYKKGTNIRRYNEAFIYIPRKNIKTSFAAGLAWALGILERQSGSKIYIVASVLKQALESFNFLKNSVKRMGSDAEKFKIIDNNNEHSISREFGDGSFFFQALASNPDKQDSLNCNAAIADELHAYKNAKQYNVIKESMKAYTNKLMIGITTAGDNMNSFCYNRLIYCKKILDQTVTDETYFVFIAEADADENGIIDYTNPLVHAQANPAYGVSIRPGDIQNDSNQALNDPQQRKDFFAKSLNVYTSSVKAYFNLDEFRKSDSLYDYGFENPIIIRDEETVNFQELADLNIKWFGGADLSKRHDLTATALYGVYRNEEDKEISIMIQHAWYPRTRATYLQDDLGIPYQSWEDTGWLSFVNGDVIEFDDVVKWFMNFKDLGFDIKTIGYDPNMATEFAQELEKHDFNVKPIGQQYWNKSKGFREIELQVKRKQFYYLHSESWEYVIENVKAMEDPEERVRFEKTSENQKIDMFDAGVAAACTYLDDKLDDTINLDEWEW